jgi:hypothetical protein
MSCFCEDIAVLARVWVEVARAVAETVCAVIIMVGGIPPIALNVVCAIAALVVIDDLFVITITDKVGIGLTPSPAVLVGHPKIDDGSV